MDKLYAGKIFAHYYQFYLLDGNLSADEWPIDWNQENIKIGYITSGRAIAVSTVADLNSHWFEVFLGETSPSLENCERGLVLNMEIPSGVLEIRSPSYEEVRLSISPGYYAVYILAYSLGLEEEEQLGDNELEQRMDLERYKVVLVPGKITNEGVIKGDKYLPR